MNSQDEFRRLRDPEPPPRDGAVAAPVDHGHVGPPAHLARQSFPSDRQGAVEAAVGAVLPGEHHEPRGEDKDKNVGNELRKSILTSLLW